MDFPRLLFGFVKTKFVQVDALICQSCSLYFSPFNAYWSFCFDLNVLNESKYYVVPLAMVFIITSCIFADIFSCSHCTHFADIWTVCLEQMERRAFADFWRLSCRQMERRSTCMSAGRKTLAHLLLHPSALVFLMRFEESLSKYKPFHGRCWAVGRCMNVRVRNWNLTISLMKRWQMHRLSCLKEVSISPPTYWSKCRQDPITLETLTIEGIVTWANIQTRAVFSM